MSISNPLPQFDMSAEPASPPECLTELIRFLDGLQGRSPMDELERQLAQLDLCQDDLRDFAKFENCTYRRNLICEGKWYELLCICWHSGQRSPIHNHAGSTCGLRIIEGVCTETVFEPTACGQIKAVKSTDCNEGFVCTSQDSDIHQISNLQAPGRDLITLHIYSPPLRTMDTFSLFSSESEPYSPASALEP